MPYDAIHKKPNARLDYLFQWRPFLGDDTIATSTFPNFPPGITQVSTSNTTTDVTLWLDDGVSDRDYSITNHIVTADGREMDWTLVVRVSDYSPYPTVLSPPYAHIVEHTAYTPQAEGESAFKLEMVARDAADIVQYLVPKPKSPQSVLTQAMDATQTTLTISEPYPYTMPGEPPTLFPEADEIMVDSEIIAYSDRVEYSTLADLRRGAHGTVAASHLSGAVVKSVGYALRARRAELAIFEWLFLTRGWRPSRSGVLGSENYQVGDEAEQIVRKIMGPYYGRRGGAIRKSVPMSTFPRRRGSSYDWQKGWYDVRP